MLQVPDSPFDSPLNQRLVEFFASHPRLFVLTGAGISTASGIPDYRDDNGNWKLASQPVKHAEFVASVQARQRYWARSAVGWPVFRKAIPNAAHHALARLEQDSRIEMLVTQNVDRLHGQAGSRRVIDLHGVLQQVVCLDCAAVSDRDALQQRLVYANPQLAKRAGKLQPDGDVNLQDLEFSNIQIPPCTRCGGILKPDVVFFGDSVPRTRVERCFEALESADAVLVVGSSLQVFSGFRFVRAAVEKGLPVAAINRGETRADHLLEFRLSGECGEVLDAVVAAI